MWVFRAGPLDRPVVLFRYHPTRSGETALKMVDAMITAFGVVMVERVGRAARIMIAFDSFFIELAGTTVLFALFFRYLPDVKLNWKDIWMELANEQWKRIEPIIVSSTPPKDPRGRPARDPREVLNGIL